MTKDKELYNLERRYVGKEVWFYATDVMSKHRFSDGSCPKQGPFKGFCDGLHTAEYFSYAESRTKLCFNGFAFIIPEENLNVVLNICLKDVFTRK